jgi:hypothetical protein
MIIPVPAIFHEKGEAPLNAALKSSPVREDRAVEGNADDDLSFWDLLDVVNPLQHIPVVSSIYRHVSGDEIGGLARLAGGFLFGGPIGLASSAANLGLEMATGQDLGSHLISALDGEMDEVSGTTDAGTAARAARAYGEEGTRSGRQGAAVDFYDIDIPR